ncbi:MAG: ATP-binding protein [FCB group bacterium]|nr:ATP-binding protein [FCB group bacterium]
MIKRQIEKELVSAAESMPVVSLTGPRQSGKTTLVKSTFPKHRYVNLEEPDTREYAITDPRGFLNDIGGKVIIDECQYAKDIFSYIQADVDNNPQYRKYILTGSQNILMSDRISQSLAGRAAILRLLPFSISELENTPYQKDSYADYLYQGFYPRIYDHKLDPARWYASYINTYLERDVRQILNVGDLHSFQTFIKLCAGRIGQLINLSAMSNEIGVSYQTVKRWLSVLEASYIIFMLPPYYRNFNKRVVKAPRLYFYDPGLAVNILGLKSSDQVTTHYMKGELFESLVISEIRKSVMNSGAEPSMYFWRDSNGNEVDCILDTGSDPIAIEIKAAMTLNQHLFKGLKKWQELSGLHKDYLYLVYGGDENQDRTDVIIRGWKHMPFPE